MADIADDERVGADRAPVGKARRGVDVAHLLEKRAAVERLEQARVLEVGGDDVGDVGGELGIGPEENRNGNRNRRDGALRLPALQSAAGRVPPRKPPPPRRRGCAARARSGATGVEAAALRGPL